MSGYGRIALKRYRAYHSEPWKMADARPTSFCRSDIRSAKQKQFSRPMTGHTPQKLPSFDAISCIIAVRAQNVPTRARLSYHYLQGLSRTFSGKITKFLLFFQCFYQRKRQDSLGRPHIGIYTVLKKSFSPQEIHRPWNTQSISASSGHSCEEKS